MQERSITQFNVQKTKKHGSIALHVLFESNNPTIRAKDHALATAEEWRRRLENRFPAISALNSVILERVQYPRVELPLANTAGLARDVKRFLEEEGYFSASRAHRLAYSLRSEEAFGAEFPEALVVEGGFDGPGGCPQVNGPQVRQQCK